MVITIFVVGCTVQEIFRNTFKYSHHEPYTFSDPFPGLIPKSNIENCRHVPFLPC